MRILPLLRLLVRASFFAASTATKIITRVTSEGTEDVWRGDTVRDLHAEYPRIFTHGNRNAASHLWATFLFDRAHQMTEERLLLMFSGFCAVSGSPVRPSDYSRYFLRLPSVVAGRPLVPGFMHYCCWPCVCDTQDFIRVDTLTVGTRDGPREYNVAVIGNPCDHPEKMTEPFVQPFGYRKTTVVREAPMLRCAEDGSLKGATLSDHGFVIISLFFSAPSDRHLLGRSFSDRSTEEDAAELAMTSSGLVVRPPLLPQPGRMSESGGVTFQDEVEFSDMCSERAAKGYNSGMGEIFRRVASISSITPQISS